jgi:hypothetical protein
METSLTWNTFPCKNFTKSLNTVTLDWVQNEGIPFYELLVPKCQQENKLTTSVVHSLSSQANIGLANILWYLKAQYHVQKSPPNVPVLKRIQFTLCPLISLKSISILYYQLHLDFSSSLFRFLDQNLIYISSIPYVLHAQATPSSLIWNYSTKSTNY